MNLKRGWIADLSPTLKAVIDERGNVSLTRHGTDTFTVNQSEATKLINAWNTIKGGDSA